MAPVPDSNPPTGSSGSSKLALKLKQILKSNGVDDPICEIKFKDSGLRGENMASETEYIEIHFANSNKPLHLFMKKIIEDSAHGKILEDAEVFRKETMFFQEYLPDARKLCKSMGQEDLMKIYPKCYYGDNKWVVFENLVIEKGYTILDKIKKQDLEATKFSIQNLAKHHAIAHALIEQYGGPQLFFERYPLLKLEGFTSEGAQDMFRSSIENGIITNLNLLERSKLDFDQKIIETLKSFQGKAFGHMMELINRPSSNLNVLNHGDFWNNNMMFLKDKKTGQIIDNILIDFQITRYGSPCLDLGYFMYTSVQGGVRQKHLQEILQLYLDTLKMTTKQLGFPLDMTLDELKQEFQHYFYFGFYVGSLMASEAAFSILKDIDLKKINDGNDWGNIFAVLIRQWIDAHPEKCKAIGKAVVDDMKEFDLISQGIFP